MGVGGDQSGMDKLIIERGLLINKSTIADGYAPMLMELIDTPSDLFKEEGCWSVPGFVKPSEFVLTWENEKESKRDTSCRLSGSFSLGSII